MSARLANFPQIFPPLNINDAAEAERVTTRSSSLVGLKVDRRAVIRNSDICDPLHPLPLSLSLSLSLFRSPRA